MVQQVNPRSVVVVDPSESNSESRTSFADDGMTGADLEPNDKDSDSE